VKIGYVMQEGVDVRRPPFNGPATHVREVVAALTARGHGVRLLFKVEGRTWRSDDLETFEPVEVGWDRGARRLLERVARRAQSELRLPYAAMFESLRFAQAVRQELAGADVLYERLSWVAYGSGLAAGRLRVPLVLEDNGDHLFDLEAKGIAPTGAQQRRALGLMRRAVHRAAHVVSTGAGWREQFIKRWRFDPGRITTIENGTTLVHMLAREQLRSFGPAEEPAAPVTLVYLGGFYPWHGVPNLLSALARARARAIDARLLLIGAGDGLPDARRLAAALGLESAVTFAGHLGQSAYAPLLAGADVGLSPYCGWPEFSGLKVLDYKAAGLPTVASGVPGHPPTLRAGVTGLIVPPCDVDALADALVRICADARGRRRMGQAARLEAETMHGWEHTAARLEQVLLEVTGDTRH
jgi:glycosyltransferase involved in cell wall biosynthesis